MNSTNIRDSWCGARAAPPGAVVFIPRIWYFFRGSWFFPRNRGTVFTTGNTPQLKIGHRASKHVGNWCRCLSKKTAGSQFPFFRKNQRVIWRGIFSADPRKKSKSAEKRGINRHRITTRPTPTGPEIRGRWSIFLLLSRRQRPRDVWRWCCVPRKKSQFRGINRNPRKNAE